MPLIDITIIWISQVTFSAMIALEQFLPAFLPASLLEMVN
jgi:hypothetical protein